MNEHHILFSRATWEADPCGKNLRRDHRLRIDMDEAIHNEIHRDISLIPVLGHKALVLVQNEFYCGNNSIETLDNLMTAFDKVEHSNKMSYVDRRLAEIAIEAIGMQIPYIKFGEIKR